MPLVSLVVILAVLLAAISPMLAVTLIPINPVIVHPADLPFKLHTKLCWFPQSRVRFPLGISKPKVHIAFSYLDMLYCVFVMKRLPDMYNTHSFQFPRKGFRSMHCTINNDSIIFSLYIICKAT